MGLDAYVGQFTRYNVGDRLTTVQQVMQAQGHTVQIVRAEAEPDDAVMDTQVVQEAVQQWQP